MATFDLRTGIGRPPNPADYITKKNSMCSRASGNVTPVMDDVPRTHH
jgi:hypothetical protein